MPYDLDHPYRPGALLRHYKGGRYRVTSLCLIEATKETGVLYEPQQGDERVTWLRPLKEFGDRVRLPDGREVLRFEVIEQAAAPRAPAGRPASPT